MAAFQQSFLQGVTGIHFPARWPYLGVYVRAQRALVSGFTWNDLATATLGGDFSGAMFGSEAFASSGSDETPYTVPADPGFAVGSGAFAHARYENVSDENKQGSRIIRLTSGKAYNGSITCAQSDTAPNTSPPRPLTVAITVQIYIIRLVAGSVMNHTNAGTAISIPVTTILGTLNYNLVMNVGDNFPTRTDNFSFTAP